MLREVLKTVEEAGRPITLTELSSLLNIDPGVLDGMLEHWARKGRLVVDGRSAATCSGSCVAASCRCGACSGVSGCPFMARLPLSFAVARPADPPSSSD